jgi:hypothetical protein
MDTSYRKQLNINTLQERHCKANSREKLKIPLAVAIFRCVFKREMYHKDTAEDCHSLFSFIFLLEKSSQ